MFHCILLVVIRFNHLEPPEEHRDGWDDAETKGDTPDYAKVVETETITREKVEKQEASAWNLWTMIC